MPSAVMQVIEELSRSGRGIKVAIVDDDLPFLGNLEADLSPWGFELTLLSQPQQLWSVLNQVNPDVLVLDVDMPGLSGRELCQVLRSDLCWQRLPILFLSAHPDLLNEPEALAIGADDFLCKPIAAADLASRILTRLERARSQGVSRADV
ncbi:MAG: response regulator [Chloroflexaceae bacterium]|nr:response regulator [Chloroflexaceae bacterium]